MDRETLLKANQLDGEIRELERILDCFEWDPDDDLGSDKNHVHSFTRHPKIIIEFDADDGNGTDVIGLPDNISKMFIPAIKQELYIDLTKAKNAYTNL